MDNIAVILIIVLASVYVARHFYKKIVPKDRGTCGRGCSSCGSAGTPGGPEKPLP
ncbi:MAG: FeoB-associated Cys-rich membrane protein [Deltaproteobacteria bacterium]|nr:FeoB-associated Cys-rich membrane protein [Deltaproteobacteria bacterium]